MVRRMFVVAMAAMMFCLMGCSKDKLTPEQITALCSDAGQVSALAWVAKDTPTPDEVKAVKFVLDEISKGMAGYQGDGFAGMLPQINEAIKKAFPGTDERSLALQKMAILLATRTLTNLDELFAKHPEWDKKGDVAAGYVKAFTDGGSTALNGFIKSKSAPAADSVKKEVPPPAVAPDVPKK